MNVVSKYMKLVIFQKKKKILGPFFIIKILLNGADLVCLILKFKSAKNGTLFPKLL